MCVQPGVEAASRWTNSSPLVPVGRLLRWCCQAMHNSACWEDKTQQTFIEIREEQTVYREECFFHEGSQAVEQVPKGFVLSLSLEVFKTQLITALSVLVAHG